MEINSRLDKRNLINKKSEKLPEPCIVLQEIDYEKEISFLEKDIRPFSCIIGCLILFIPSLGSILYTIKYYKYLTLNWAILFISHIVITFLAIACMVFADNFCDI